MRRDEFYYDLPEELIAQYPLPERTASRLLCLDGSTGDIWDRCFSDLPMLLRPGDLLVFNDTRVMPARLFGRKPTGGRVEILIERILDDTHILAQVRASKPTKPGGMIWLAENIGLELLERQESFSLLVLKGADNIYEVMERYGHIPLPPYMQREDELTDRERYQTVFSRSLGAVAAPTAGLHFDEALLAQLRQQGIAMGFVTLHVGAGTFQPVREEAIERHRMHKEYLAVSPQVCEQILAARARGGRVVAVGTTTVRALESASQSGTIQPYQGETEIFITPGYRFRSVDALITNFHLPESTLLMLVSAFVGREQVLAAYRHAVAERYRFFSYGDAMWVARMDVDYRQPPPSDL